MKILPTAPQLAWQLTETNLFVHLCINTFTAGSGATEPNPPRYFIRPDCRQWAREARKAGMKIGVLTAKHHDGFCLWPSATTDHSVKFSP